jgi:hypothetical protein
MDDNGAPYIPTQAEILKAARLIRRRWSHRTERRRELGFADPEDVKQVRNWAPQEICLGEKLAVASGERR